MATTKQKQAAVHNLEKAREAKNARTQGPSVHKKDDGLSAAEKRDLDANQFAFPKQRKEPLSDASHVRNALARFDQVEGVTDAERSEAWKRIKAAADRFGVEVEAEDWRELFGGGRAKKKP